MGIKSDRLLLLLFALFSFCPIRAQYSDSTSYFTGISSTGTYNQTNVSRTFLLNNTLRFGVRKKKIAFNAFHKHLFGKQGDKLVNNDFTAVYDFNIYSRWPKFYYWGLMTYNNVYSLRINHQLQAGAGIAYDLLQKGPSQLNISDGILYDFSDIQLKDTVRDVYETYRNSFRIQYKLTLKNLSFRAAGFIQNSFEYKKDYIIKTDASLSYRVRKWLSLTMQANYNKMNRTQKETLFITYGLLYEKYF